MTKTWAQKQAEARAKWQQRRKTAGQRKRSSAVGQVENDFFDIFSQLTGVTNEWSGAGKRGQKRKK